MNNPNVKEILDTIDTSRKFYEKNLFTISQDLDIHDPLKYQDQNRLNKVPYHTWFDGKATCGIFVWYLDDEPVCFSWKRYPKQTEIYYWLNEDAVIKTRQYLLSLVKANDLEVKMMHDSDLDMMSHMIQHSDHKNNETINIKKS
jgi:hypothetical protein